MVDNITVAWKALEAAKGDSDVYQARGNLASKAVKLSKSLGPPKLDSWLRCFQVNVGVAVEILTNLGLWQILGNKEEVTLDEIAEKTDADEIMISMYLY